MDLPFEQLVEALSREAFVYRKAVVALFVFVTIAAAVVGLSWPLRYTSATTILVEEKNIIQPLMQGAAVDTGVMDRASIAREVIYGHKIMDQIAVDAGWVKSDTTPKQKADIIHNILIPRTKISHVGDNKNIIKIQYSDDNPKRAYLTAKELADLFIAVTLQAKAKESEDAFNFIDQQVQQYRAKLTTAEDALKQFQSANLRARPGSEEEIGKRLNDLQDKIDQTDEELKETEIKQNSLKKQLSGEAEATAVFSQDGQYRTRIAELQAQLATLRLNYQDTYPDIVRIKHQIEDLDQAIAEDQAKQKNGKAGSQQPANDESLMLNPLYQQLRQELSQTKTKIATLNARSADYRQLLQEELSRGRQVHGGEATLAELTRDYTVNRDIYQDLLRRRENARVSMNLDKQKEGLTFQIQDHATMPLEPNSLRFSDFIFGGFILALILPIGLLYAKLKFDPRVCLESSISEKLRLPVLTVVPHLFTPGENSAAIRSLQLLGSILIADIALLGGISILKVVGVI